MKHFSDEELEIINELKQVITLEQKRPYFKSLLKLSNELQVKLLSLYPGLNLESSYVQLFYKLNFDIEIQSNYCATCGNKVSDKIIINTLRQLKYNKNRVNHVFCQQSCSTMNNDVISNRIKTSMNNYGVPFSTMSQNKIEEIKKSNLLKYGVDNPMKLEHIKKKCIDTNKNIDKTQMNLKIQQRRGIDTNVLYNLKSYYNNKNIITQEEFQRGILDANCKSNAFRVNLRKAGIKIKKSFRQKYEIFLTQFLKDLYPNIKVIFSDRKVLNGLELDFYIPEKNLAIEFNGDYWHSTSIDDDINQQLKKTNLCEQQGIHLIHIWEHEWLNNQEFIKELLKLYIEDKVHQNEFQKLIEQFNGRLPRDYFQILDFSNYTLVKPEIEELKYFKIYKTGYIIL